MLPWVLRLGKVQRQQRPAGKARVYQFEREENA